MIAIHFGEPLSLISPTYINNNKKDKNRDSSNRHRFLSLPTRGKQTSQIKMSLLCKRLILTEAFDMKNFSQDFELPVH